MDDMELMRSAGVTGKYFSINFGRLFSIIRGILFSIPAIIPFTNVYSLKTASKTTKEKVRKFIKRQLEHEYKLREWSELSSLEKESFIYITIRQKMEKYVEPAYKSKVDNRIDSHLKETLINSASDLKSYNDAINSICVNYFNPTEDETTRKEIYKLFSKALHDYNRFVPIPSYDEWCLHPLRPIDYIASFEQEILEKDDNSVYPSQSEIDHVIVQILMKEFTERTKKTIDTSKIFECLKYTKNFDVNEFDILLDEYDSNINIPKEKQEKIIQGNRMYFSYKKMLEELKFLK